MGPAFFVAGLVLAETLDQVSGRFVWRRLPKRDRLVPAPAGALKIAAGEKSAESFSWIRRGRLAREVALSGPYQGGEIKPLLIGGSRFKIQNFPRKIERHEAAAAYRYLRAVDPHRRSRREKRRGDTGTAPRRQQRREARERWRLSALYIQPASISAASPAAGSRRVDPTEVPLFGGQREKNERG